MNVIYGDKHKSAEPSTFRLETSSVKPRHWRLPLKQTHPVREGGRNAVTVGLFNDQRRQVKNMVGNLRNLSISAFFKFQILYRCMWHALFWGVILVHAALSRESLISTINRTLVVGVMWFPQGKKTKSKSLCTSAVLMNRSDKSRNLPRRSMKLMSWCQTELGGQCWEADGRCLAIWAWPIGPSSILVKALLKIPSNQKCQHLGYKSIGSDWGKLDSLISHLFLLLKY